MSACRTPIQEQARTKTRAMGAWMCAAVLVLMPVALAQSRNTEHTLKLDDPGQPAKAAFEDIGWMIGSWEGEAFGGSFEEDWLRPTAGTMTGIFKLVHEDRPSRYEFMMIVEENESLTIKLKHFNADFSAWEEKSEFVSFPLVKLTEDAAYFDGLTYQRLTADQLLVHVSIGDDKQEEKLEFRRAKAARAGAAGGNTSRAPYAGLETRRVKALSAQQVVSYRAGDGMGFAMAAELNGYPGPKHVLELRDTLGLSAEQLAATQRAFETMRLAAVELGTRIVDREEQLDRLFAGHRINGQDLESLTAESARLEGELRAVHLKAHLEMLEILSPAQRHAYVSARGYHAAAMFGGHHPGDHGN